MIGKIVDDAVMDTQIQTSPASGSARNQQDDVHNRQQLSLQRMAARTEKSTFKDEVSEPKADAPQPLDLQVHQSVLETKALDTQLLLSQMLMASALYWPQLAMTSARQDMAASSVRHPQRIENALASYRAISSVTETESGAGLAATA
ncbi:hypothetical protein [Iodobacter fluviatilis]|uniref:Uncharacterized protein n=2 Tax=Iodobacter fluviatilis TaxID=537 RepID=A0A377Q5A5_9NEIS|nr:hypothetical protein [Iodobacter fluviatilis]TCU84165.1 hypothetical protein EV682_110104 [Iodobacter fluviatilis]STQ89779.1 Uncharacterised protein [Iodobacter fluviatilis]